MSVSTNHYLEWVFPAKIDFNLILFLEAVVSLQSPDASPAESEIEHSIQ